MFRRSRPDPLEQVRPDTLGRRWAPPLAATIAARQRFRRLVAGSGDGPIRDHLEQLAAEVDSVVIAAWDRARQADQLESTVGELDIATAAGRLKAARRELNDLTSRDGPDAALVAARATVEREAERFATLNRLVNELDDLADRLSRLAGDLDATVAAAAELTLVQSLAEPSLEPVAARMSALRAAFDELR